MRKSFENHPSSFLLCGDMILVPWVIAATKFDYPLVIVMYVCVYRERRLSFESRMAFWKAHAAKTTEVVVEKVLAPAICDGFCREGKS